MTTSLTPKELYDLQDQERKAAERVLIDKVAWILMKHTVGTEFTMPQCNSAAREILTAVKLVRP